jgi:hypothetical protein
VFARPIAREVGAEELEIFRVRNVRMENLNLLSQVRAISNEELFAEVEAMTMTEHGFLVKVVVILGEIDRRGSYREKAWPSLFEYCVSHLKYSEGQACRRIYSESTPQIPGALATLREARDHADESSESEPRADRRESHGARARCRHEQ